MALVTIHYTEVITERKQAELALRQSEEKYRELFETAPVVIFKSNLQGRCLSVNPVYAFMSSSAPMVVSEIDTGRFIEFNDRWVEMTGYAQEEQIGRTSHELELWADPEDRRRIVDALLVQDSSKDVPIVFKHKSGDPLYVRWSAEIISIADKHVMRSLFFDETSNRKAAMEKKSCKMDPAQMDQILVHPETLLRARSGYQGSNGSG